MVSLYFYHTLFSLPTSIDAGSEKKNPHDELNMRVSRLLFEEGLCRSVADISEDYVRLFFLR